MWQPFPWWLWFMTGSVIASFLNVCISRLPRDESPLRGRSHCPACGQRIAWYDLVPVLSWLWLGGRCRRCRAPISPRYLIVELLGGLTAVLIGWRFGVTPEALLAALAACVLAVGAFIDLENLMVSDLFTWVPAVPVVLLWLWVRPSFVREAALSAVGFFLLQLAIAWVSNWQMRRRMRSQPNASCPSGAGAPGGAPTGAAPDAAGTPGAPDADVAAPPADAAPAEGDAHREEPEAPPARPALHPWGHHLTWTLLCLLGLVVAGLPRWWLVGIVWVLGMLMLRYQRDLHASQEFVTVEEYVEQSARTGESLEALGAGDACFAALVGALLGHQAFLALFFLAPVLHILWYAVVLWRRMEVAPYLPALSLATLLVFFFGEEISRWFLLALMPAP